MQKKLLEQLYIAKKVHLTTNGFAKVKDAIMDMLINHINKYTHTIKNQKICLVITKLVSKSELRLYEHIYAMINNFQSRISILEQVISTIEEVKNLNNTNDEITI